MSDARRDRFFGGFVAVGRRRPGLIALVIMLLVVAGLWLGRSIDINTSRYDMVSPKDPYQAQLLGFFERFGYPDAPVVIVRGGTPEQRHAAADTLIAAYAADPMFEGRVLGKVGASEVAEVLFLQQPGALADLRKSLPPQADLPAMVEGGLPTMMGAIEEQLLAGLDGEVEVEEAEAAAGMQRLAGMARLLDAHLKGEDTAGTLGDFAGERTDQARDAGLDDQGYLSSRDGEMVLIALFPSLEGTRVEDYEPVVTRTREIRDRVVPELEGVDVLLSGLPMLVVDEQEVIGRAVIVSAGVSGAGVLLILLLGFRSIRSTIYALIPLTLGMAISLGFAQIIYGHLNPITAAMFAILLGLGIDFAVHLLARFQEFLREGMPRREAVMGAVRTAGPGVFTGGITSAAAILTVVTATFTAFSEFGVLNAVGLVVVFLTTMLLLPIMLDRLGGGEAAPRVPGIDLLPAIVRRGPKMVLVLAVLLAAGGIYGATHVRFNARYFDYMPSELESVQALDALEKDGMLSPLFAYASAEDVAAARKLAEDLRSAPSVGAVQTPTDLLPELDESTLGSLRAGFEGLARDPDFEKLAGREPTSKELAPRVRAVVDALDELRFALEQAERPTKEVEDARKAYADLLSTVESLPDDGKVELARTEDAFADLLGRAWKTGRAVAARGSYSAEDLPKLFQTRYAARDGSGAVSMFVFPVEPIWAGDGARQFSDQVRSLDPAAAGHAISMHIHNEMIIDDFVRAAVLAGVLVFGLLFIDFRRVSDTLIALTPVTIGGVFMAGIMAIIDLPFSVGNIMVLPFLIGLGIDAGVHMVHRARQSATENGRTRLEDLLTGTGAAVLLASVTTMAGFGGLVVSGYGAIEDFGLTMLIGIGATLVATLFVLPALLVVVGRGE